MSSTSIAWDAILAARRSWTNARKPALASSRVSMRVDPRQASVVAVLRNKKTHEVLQAAVRSTTARGSEMSAPREGELRRGLDEVARRGDNWAAQRRVHSSAWCTRWPDAAAPLCFAALGAIANPQPINGLGRKFASSRCGSLPLGMAYAG
jgi:hypothetical protein